MATTVKWQGSPHLGFANGVGGFRWYRNLLNASPRAFLDATVSDDRVHLRTITVPHSLGRRTFQSIPLFQGSVQTPQLLSGGLSSDAHCFF
ncbi:hypothetical protein CWI75_00730 [Kineobactrum sediminis]|uniref:Uncharacterized protein n=1 Tax=Kineobactrum sediminis TaxID=1905677 RepID=A0A2N5Y695_9GAMM|nr:hypothetical protein CWI75_00730 [Kineobactrum sediminis]